MAGGWLRKKPMDALERTEEAHRLKKTLSWPHLMALGVGAIVGTGIYTLIGVGANLAGPGVMLSFAIAGVICVCAGLCYAEMATTIPAAGSAYTYTYSVLGETLAWIVGWSLILEYTVVCSAVAVGWAGHAVEFIHAYHWPIPDALLNAPFAVSGAKGAEALKATGALINLPAVLIVFVVAGFLIAGTKESANINIGLVAIKLVALAIFVTLAFPAFNGGHFNPFMPNGFSGVNAEGTKIGVMPAASIIFFAFYGFDAVSTAAEETKNPGRDLTIGIIGSMVVCIVIYMAVAAAAIGAVAPAAFAKSTAPLVFVLEQLKHSAAAQIVAGAAVLALPTVILAFMYGQSRIFFVMARDGLLPRALSKVNAKTGTPVVMTLVTAVVAGALAGAFPLDLIAALANAGTLCAFVATIACVVVLRIKDPDRKRVFKAPVWWLLALIGIPGCIWLFTTLSNLTIVLFFAWNALGLVIYALFSRRSSLLAKG
jgi:APA family basic amino acid/polyamine antiporter